MFNLYRKWATPVKSIAKIPSDAVFGAAKKASWIGLVWMSLGAGLSYAAYAADLAVSEWPWRIGVLVTLVCSLGPFIVYLKARRTNALWAIGTILAIGVFAVYYFFGILSYFYFCLFVPMPGLVRWLGFVGGAVLTIYWAWMISRGVRRTIRCTSFVKKAFTDDGEVICYHLQDGMRVFERLNKERLPFPKIYLYLVYGISPFYLIMNRLLSDSFGSTGVLLFVAIMGMPVSLWIAGLFVRICLVMIVLPLNIERERRKPVVVVT